jgi:hypothetical protein
VDNTSQAQQTDTADALFTTTAAKNSFLSRLIIFNEEILSRNRCTNLVTDGAGAIRGARQGFHARAKDIN